MDISAINKKVSAYLHIYQPRNMKATPQKSAEQLIGAMDIFVMARLKGKK